MKEKAFKLLALLAASACLTACDGNNEGYIDTSEFVDSLENNDIQISEFFSGHGFDDSAFSIMNSGFSANENYFYVTQTKNIRVDGNTGEVQFICHKPGCAHTQNSSDCYAYKEMTSALTSPNGIYFCDENKLCLYDGKETKTLFTNDFCTDYEKEYFPDSRYMINHLTYHDDLIYFSGVTFYMSYDIQSGAVSKPAVISDAPIRSFDTDGENIFFTDENAGLFVYNISSAVTKHIGDNVWQLDFINDKLYYTQYENGIPMLYSADKTGENAVKLIEDCYVNFCVLDDCIYYQNYTAPEHNIYVCNIDGTGAKKITLPRMTYIDEEGEEKEEDFDYINGGFVNIISNSASSKIFITGGSWIWGRVYAFEKGSEQSTVFSIEEYYEEFKPDNF